MRLFLDANVLFTAAHNPLGKAALVIELAEADAWQIFTSAYAVEEARRNLSGKFPDRLPTLDRHLAAIQVIKLPPSADCPLPLRAKDQPIFVAAQHCRATHLLTGDLRDFGPFMNCPEKTFGICIQTVADFLRQV